KVIVWDVATGKALAELPAHAGNVRAVAFSPDGKHILTGGTDRAARVWDVRTKELMTVFPKRDPKAPRDDSQQVWAAAVSPDGSKVLTGTWGGQLVSYDARTAEVLAQAQAHANVVRAVAFSADGKTAYSCGEDGSGRRWEVATLSELPTPLFAPGTLVGL